MWLNVSLLSAVAPLMQRSYSMRTDCMKAMRVGPFLMALVGLTFVGTARLGAGPITYSFDDTAFYADGYGYPYLTDGWAGKGLMTVDFGANQFGFNYYGYNISGGGDGALLDDWTSVELNFTVLPYLQLVIYSDPATGQIIYTGGYDLGANDRFASPFDEWNSFRDYFAPYGIVITPVDTSSVPDTGSTIALLGCALGGLAMLRRRFAK
jgi:VPDSG-CTERM motif